MALTHTPSVDSNFFIPKFDLPTLQGPSWRSDSIPANSPALFMFICNHCPYVKAIESRLVQLGEDLRKINVPVIAIASNDAEAYPEDSRESLLKNAEQKKMNFVYLWDETQEVAKKFGAVCTPDFFLFDRSHQLRYRGRLDDSWKDPALVTRRELFEAAKTLQAGEKIQGEIFSAMGCSIKWKK